MIKYSQYYKKVKEKYEVNELERYAVVFKEEGIVKIPKPFSEKEKEEALVRAGFPVETVKNLHLLKGTTTEKRAEKLLSIVLQEAEQMGRSPSKIRKAVRKMSLALEGSAGIGKTSSIALLVSKLWDYYPWIVVYYLTPFDFEFIREGLESWKSIDLIVLDNFDHLREGSGGFYVDLSHEDRRVLQKLVMKAFDENKGIIFISNSDVDRALITLGGISFRDRIKQVIKLSDTVSYRTGIDYTPVLEENSAYKGNNIRG